MYYFEYNAKSSKDSNVKCYIHKLPELASKYTNRKADVYEVPNKNGDQYVFLEDSSGTDLSEDAEGTVTVRFKYTRSRAIAIHRWLLYSSNKDSYRFYANWLPDEEVKVKALIMSDITRPEPGIGQFDLTYIYHRGG